MASLHTKAIVIAVIHYFLSFGVAFLGFAVAWGSGLSDASHGDGALWLFGFFLVVLQAPVALIQWMAAHASADGKTGLEIPIILLLAIPSSLFYGYMIAFLFRRKSPSHDSNVA